MSDTQSPVDHTHTSLNTQTKIVVTFLGLLVGVFVAWLGFAGLKTKESTDQLQTAIEQIKDSASELDFKAIQTHLEAAAGASRKLNEATASPQWKILESIPLIGRSAKAVNALGDATTTITSAALPLVASIGTPQGAPATIMALLNSESQLVDLANATEKANQQLQQVNVSLLMPGLSGPVNQAQELLPQLASATRALAQGAKPLNAMLGTRKPTTWLVMAQNPAELRGSGGLFSAYLLLKVTNGQPKIIEAGSRKQIDHEFPRAEQIPYKQAIDSATANSWGPVLGEWASFNMPNDFTTIGKLAAAGMAKRGTPIDGVIAIDPAMVAAILAGTGPVEHQGVSINSTNAYTFFTKDIYAKYPDFPNVAEKDKLSMGLIYATIDAALNRPLDTRSLWPQISTAINQGHLKIWAKNPTQEAWLSNTEVAASFAQHPDQLNVSYNNASGGKLDPYITKTVTIDASQCQPDNKTEINTENETKKSVTATITLVNNVPQGLPNYVDVALNNKGIPDPSIPSGFTRTYVTTYLPEGAAVTATSSNGNPTNPWPAREAGRDSLTFPVELNRGDRTTLHLTYSPSKCPTKVG